MSSEKFMDREFTDKRLTIAQKPYKINSLIGEGAHATVWAAKGLLYPHDLLTVKIAKDEDGVAHERVQNEIWFLKEVSHPHIPPLIDCGKMDGHLWLSMPIYQHLLIHLPDQTKLKTVEISDIRAEGYPSEAESVPLKYREQTAIGVLRDIGRVIDYLAGTGIIHADISPGNIMEKKGSLVQKHYLLIDWGASALLHRYPSNTFGSLHFTAPERLVKEAGIKSDLFSLGVTAFYILTGTVPFGGSTGELYYIDCLERDGISPSEIVPKINSALDRTVKDLIRCHAQDRIGPKELCRRMEKFNAIF